MSFLFEQLPLAVQLRDDATLDNYFPGDNHLLLNSLRCQFEPAGERYLYLYGAQGSGRSHLLQAACHQAEQLGLTSVYLPLRELRHLSPSDLFESLEQLSLVCIDDVDVIAGNSAWEQQLFHLFNRLQERQVRLLLSANCAVRELKIELADLASRLSWGAVFHINSLSDQQRVAAIQFRATGRGLQLSDEVAQFIYHRCQRDTQALLTVLDTLDHASLKQQRRLTVPFVKATLGW